MRDIFIYGEVVPSFVGSYDGMVTLKSVIDQLDYAQGEDVRVRINCIGGSVDEGFAIYNELRRYAAKNKAQITTIAEGQCASIATVIFLAGDKRIVNEHFSPFVHEPWFEVGASTADSLIKDAKMLEKCREQIAKHYEKHTEMTYQDALNYMANDTFLTPEQCVELRFAHEIERVNKPLNKINFNKKMSKNRKKSGFLARFEKLFGAKNKLVKTADQRDVDFYDLAEDEIVEVGDFANVDGDGDYSGEVEMSTGETYVFEHGELKAIIAEDVEAEVVITEEEVEELELVFARLVRELRNAKNKNTSLQNKLNKYESVKNSFEKGKTTVNKGGTVKGNGLGRVIGNLKTK